MCCAIFILSSEIAYHIALLLCIAGESMCNVNCLSVSTELRELIKEKRMVSRFFQHPSMDVNSQIYLFTKRPTLQIALLLYPHSGEIVSTNRN